MAMPKSVVKVSKDGVSYTSSVDRVQHTLRELQFRANYDVARFLMYRMRQEISKSKSMKNLPKNRKTNIFQYWVRKRDNDLQVGIKSDTWYGVKGELGSSNQPKRGILRNTVFDNIDTIREIQGQYLSAIGNETEAVRIAESEEPKETGGNDD